MRELCPYANSTLPWFSLGIIGGGEGKIYCLMFVINRGWGSICRNCFVWPCLIRGLVPKAVLVYNVVNLKLSREKSQTFKNNNVSCYRYENGYKILEGGST